MNKKRSLLLASVALLSTLSAAESCFDLSMAKVGFPKHVKMAGAEAVKTQFNEKNAMRINFNCEESKWVEFTFQPVKEIVLKEPSPVIRVEVEVFQPENKKASTLSLRLMDSSEHEVFQYRGKLPKKTGWGIVSFTIHTDGKQPEAWGKGNLLLDWPVRVLGLSTSGWPDKGIGFIGLGNIKITTEDK